MSDGLAQGTVMRRRAERSTAELRGSPAVADISVSKETQ